MPAPYTKIAFTDAKEGGITAQKLNKLRDDLSTAIGSGGAGTGEMTKAVYDTNANGKVDTCDSLLWGSVKGQPTTFPPDATAELVARKGVVNGYAGLDGTGKVPIAQLPATMSPAAHHTTHEHGGSDLVSVTYADLLAVPSTFNPAVHALTHKSGGVDGIKLDELAAPTD